MSTEGRASNLIASDKESGKAVYGADNKKIGSIENVMIDKPSGEIAYAVLSFGGFLGIGKDHYPVPWKVLRYDTALGGYRSDISEHRLKGAPKHGTETIFDWNARYAELDDYYNDEVIRPRGPTVRKVLVAGAGLVVAAFVVVYFVYFAA
jgi:hypothetical protein